MGRWAGVEGRGVGGLDLDVEHDAWGCAAEAGVIGIPSIGVGDGVGRWGAGGGRGGVRGFDSSRRVEGGDGEVSGVEGTEDLAWRWST